jgi:hypothetical protein
MRADMSEERYLTKMRQLNRDNSYMARLNDLLARVKKHLLMGRLLEMAFSALEGALEASEKLKVEKLIYDNQS